MSGTRPRKIGDPLGPTAMTDTRDGASPGPSGRSAAVRGVGSQTNVTRVLPLSPRDVPTQVRMTRARVVADATFDSAAVTAGGGPGLGGASALDVSSAVRAHYPLRARTWRPGRFTRTLISWNLPSAGAAVELYPSR